MTHLKQKCATMTAQTADDCMNLPQGKAACVSSVMCQYRGSLQGA